MHHVQYAAPALNKLFVDLHRRRTKGEPKVVVTKGSTTETGRKDKYIEPYTGREYGDAPKEVITMGVQMTLRRVHGKDYLRDLVEKDPELLDFVLGTLFHYDP